jgi:hypothetical protein
LIFIGLKTRPSLLRAHVHAGQNALPHASPPDDGEIRWVTHLRNRRGGTIHLCAGLVEEPSHRGALKERAFEESMMRILLGAMLGSAMSIAALSNVGASPLIRSDLATQHSIDGVVLSPDWPWLKTKHGNRGRHYGWVRGKHKGWYKHNRGRRDQPRCMIEPWLCR